MTYDIKAIKKNAEHLGNAYFDDEDKLLLIDHSTLLKHNQYEVIKYEDIMYCYVDESDGIQASNHSLGYATLGAMVGGFSVQWLELLPANNSERLLLKYKFK